MVATTDLWVYNAENLCVSFFYQVTFIFHLRGKKIPKKFFWAYLVSGIRWSMRFISSFICQVFKRMFQKKWLTEFSGLWWEARMLGHFSCLGYLGHFGPPQAILGHFGCFGYFGHFGPLWASLAVWATLTQTAYIWPKMVQSGPNRKSA